MSGPLSETVSAAVGDSPAGLGPLEEAAAMSAGRDRWFSSREFRDVLGHFPTGVAIVSAMSARGLPIGLTINSFASVSLDPPLITWNLSTRSSTLDTFRGCRHFGISFLSIDQESIARRFAVPGASEKFAQCRTFEGPEGVILLEDAVATMVCSTQHAVGLGDHLLFVGQVLHIDTGCHAPLVFHKGRFASLAIETQNAHSAEGSN